MPYKREYVPLKNQWVWKFRIKISGCFPPEIKSTIPDTGQSESDLKIHEAELIKKLKSQSESRKVKKITFSMYIDHYWNNTIDHSHPTIINDIRKAIGEVVIKGDNKFSEIEKQFTEFMGSQKGRKVMRLKVNSTSGNLLPAKTSRTISESTLQGYCRYFRAICNHGTKISLSDPLPRIPHDQNPAGTIKVGKAKNRCRPPEERERKAIYDFLLDSKNADYSFMLPVIDFSRTVPIRPNDLTTLRWDMIDQVHNQVIYLPEKTNDTGTMATPVILPVSREFVYGRIGDTACPTIFYWERNGKREHLSYWNLNSAWRHITNKLGIEDFQFYDWRHDAVNLLMSLGFNDRQIMQFTGWNTKSMLEVYDTRDRVRLSKVAKELIKTGNQEIVREVV